jgi:hypothetical protein
VNVVDLGVELVANEHVDEDAEPFAALPLPQLAAAVDVFS